MTLKSSAIIGIGMMAVTLLMPNVVFASANNPQQDFTEEEREGGFYSEDGYLLLQDNRPAINPDFAPDYSSAYLIHIRPNAYLAQNKNAQKVLEETTMMKLVFLNMINVQKVTILKMMMKQVNVDQMKNAKAMMIMYY